MEQEIKGALANINKTQFDSVKELIETKLEAQRLAINRQWGIIAVLLIVIYLGLTFIGK